MNPWPRIKSFLRKPAVVLGEIGAIAIAGALGAVLPERHVFQSAWFAAVMLLAAASLAVVVADQFRRVRAQGQQSLSPAKFQSAPFQRQFERPAGAPGTGAVRCWSERRFGAAGSLIFHAGLLALILAGAWRALFVQEAVVDLLEGETLVPAAPWAAQWPGVFGKPLRLDQPLMLEAVSGRRYGDGNLRELRAKFSAGEIAVNRQLEFAGSQLYLAQEFGPAALLEWPSQRRDAVLLKDSDGGNYAAEASGPSGLKIFLRADGERPAAFDVRVMRGNALLAAGMVRVGESLALPNGESLALRGAPMWARLRASRDSALWLAYAGMILTMAGAALMFCWIKLDFCVVVTPLGEREKVFVALKPHRFAPLFQERFENFARSELCRSRGDEAQTEIGNQSEPPYVGSYNLGKAVSVVLLAVGMTFTTGCDRVSQSQAKQLVERYNQIVSEAYRRGDVRLIDPVVGPNEGKKLTGLIGVRLDMGITLDSQLLSLNVTGVQQDGNSLRVQTKEQWSYRDLKIGSGEQVGEASKDFYEMTYVFTNVNQTWLVDEIRFTAPPQVGRTNTPWIADRREMHGVLTPEAKP